LTTDRRFLNLKEALYLKDIIFCKRRAITITAKATITITATTTITVTVSDECI